MSEGASVRAKGCGRVTTAIVWNWGGQAIRRGKQQHQFRGGQLEEVKGNTRDSREDGSATRRKKKQGKEKQGRCKDEGCLRALRGAA